MTRLDTFRNRVASIASSPWTFSFFLVIPLLVVLLRVLRLTFFPAMNLLLANNLLLLAWLGWRLVMLLRRAARPLRYERGTFRPKNGDQFQHAAGAVREILGKEGYRFNCAGTYGEKRDSGYWGTVLIHVGLFFLLVFGSYDNMHLFSGSILLGVGEPLPLYEKGAYGFWSKGLLTSYNDIDMKLQVKERILPSQRYPHGATEIVLLGRDGRELQRGITDPTTPMTQSGFNICMTRFVYDAWVVVTTTGNLVVYTDWIRLQPRADTSGAYSHYSEFVDQEGKITGRAWFDQRSDHLRFQADKGGRRIVDVVLGMGPESQKVADGYRTSLQGVGKWSEFRILRKRHVPLLIAGGMITLVGLLLRVAFRPRRVWVEEAGSGCLVRATDGRLVKTLRM